jgi:hypothetical protein
MSIQQIIQESTNQNPIGLKEALEEELRGRVAESLAEKMEEVELDEWFGKALKASATAIGAGKAITSHFSPQARQQRQDTRDAKKMDAIKRKELQAKKATEFRDRMNRNKP